MGVNTRAQTLYLGHFYLNAAVSTGEIQQTVFYMNWPDSLFDYADQHASSCKCEVNKPNSTSHSSAVISPIFKAQGSK